MSEIARHALVQLIDHGDPHRGLAGEVGVDRAAGEPRVLTDLLEGGDLEAIAQKQAAGRVDDQRSGSRLGLCTR